MTPTLTWNPVAGSNGYAVYLATTNPPTGSTITNGSSFTPATTLNVGTTYYWMVGSRDPSNNNKEADSAVWSFTTALAAPALVAPSNASTGVAVTPTLTSNAVRIHGLSRNHKSSDYRRLRHQHIVHTCGHSDRGSYVLLDGRQPRPE